MKSNRPDIYFFNPTCEYAVANGHTSWQPNLLLQKMEEDLGVLPLFFATPDDIVVVKKMPDPEYLDLLSETGIETPRFYTIRQLKDNRELTDMPKNRLLPWGWSPAAHRLLDPLKSTCSDSFKKSPVASWSNEYRDIYSKKFALIQLQQILPFLPPNKVIQPHQLPQVCTSRREIEEQICRWGKIIVKAPWSSSGRGLQRVTKTPVVEKVWDKLMGIVNEQGYAVVEPLLDKVIDMALQFSINNGRIRYLGISRFITDTKGQYQGNFLNGWPADADPQHTRFAESMAGVLIPVLTEVLEKSLLAHYYEGNFGVDTLIFRDADGNLRINPCLEINVRQNMGLLALKVEQLLVPGRKGTFNIYFRKGIPFGEFAGTMQAAHPLRIINKRIASGFFPLTPVTHAAQFGAFVLAD